MFRVFLPLFAVLFPLSLSLTAARADQAAGDAAWAAGDYAAARDEYSRLFQRDGNWAVAGRLAEIYLKGLAGEPDEQKGAFYLERAAMLGDRDAQQGIGEMYTQGRGVNRDYRAAARWYYEAALQGVTEAQKELALLYMSGRMIESTSGFGVMWADIARRNGVKGGDYLVTLAKHGTPPENIEAGLQLADDWFDFIKNGREDEESFTYHAPVEGPLNDSRFAPYMMYRPIPTALLPRYQLGCVSIDELSSRDIPPTIYAAAAACAQQGNYEQAANLRLLAEAYSIFDAQRVADKTAVAGIDVLQMDMMAALSPEVVREFTDYSKKIGWGSDEHRAFCSSLTLIGPPGYTPRYLVLFGLQAIRDPEADGLVANFDANATWQTIVTHYCRDLARATEQ
ncbi:tetratricopeptide repeat protein [Emcibacter nanhaiensis]|uniref:Sel1 repeat family protein n=1 Tax=Emcibacter nanhaiensis TaxID=1505037 RepID=A0A501PCA0_9PROT|nr:tetratricopeptide repeat protein [Emcibacter nanhaiensis]TPD57701.1 sel1 repeat family protein [Emcibacter nanhaiensis]